MLQHTNCIANCVRHSRFRPKSIIININLSSRYHHLTCVSCTTPTTLPTLPSDVLSPTVVSVSDSGPRQIHVSWGPLQPARVQRYTVEYGAIPSGRVHTVTLHSHQNSTLLTGLEPGTQYLVTVSALHVNGKERAMSVRACTQEGTFSVCIPCFYACVYISESLCLSVVLPSR